MLFTKNNAWITNHLFSNVKNKIRLCFVLDVVDINAGKIIVTDGIYFIHSVFVNDSYERMIDGFNSLQLKDAILILKSIRFVLNSKNRLEMEINDCIYMGEGSIRRELTDINNYLMRLDKSKINFLSNQVFYNQNGCQNRCIKNECGCQNRCIKNECGCQNRCIKNECGCQNRCIKNECGCQNRCIKNECGCQNRCIKNECSCQNRCIKNECGCQNRCIKNECGCNPIGYNQNESNQNECNPIGSNQKINISNKSIDQKIISNYQIKSSKNKSNHISKKLITESFISNLNQSKNNDPFQIINCNDNLSQYIKQSCSIPSSVIERELFYESLFVSSQDSKLQDSIPRDSTPRDSNVNFTPVLKNIESSGRSALSEISNKNTGHSKFYMKNFKPVEGNHFLYHPDILKFNNNEKFVKLRNFFISSQETPIFTRSLRKSKLFKKPIIKIKSNFKNDLFKNSTILNNEISRINFIKKKSHRNKFNEENKTKDIITKDSVEVLSIDEFSLIDEFVNSSIFLDSIEFTTERDFPQFIDSEDFDIEDSNEYPVFYYG